MAWLVWIDLEAWRSGCEAEARSALVYCGWKRLCNIFTSHARTLLKADIIFSVVLAELDMIYVSARVVQSFIELLKRAGLVAWSDDSPGTCLTCLHQAASTNSRRVRHWGLYMSSVVDYGHVGLNLNEFSKFSRCLTAKYPIIFELLLPSCNHVASLPYSQYMIHSERRSSPISSSVINDDSQFSPDFNAVLTPDPLTLCIHCLAS